MSTDIELESSNQENTSHDVKTSLLNNGFNQCDRETRLWDKLLDYVNMVELNYHLKVCENSD